MPDSALLAAWIETGATVVAVGAATYAGYYAKRAFDVETKRDKDRDEERRREQADKVAAWCDRYDYSPAVPARTYSSDSVFVATSRKPAPAWHYFLRNASDVPVYDVVVLFRIGNHSLGTDSVDVLPPGEGAQSRDVPASVRNEANAAAPAHGEIIRCVVSFRDTSGQRWLRSLDGRLKEDPVEGVDNVSPDSTPPSHG